MERLTFTTFMARQDRCHWGTRTTKTTARRKKAVREKRITQIKPEHHKEVFLWLVVNRRSKIAELKGSMPLWMAALSPRQCLQAMTVFFKAYPGNLQGKYRVLPEEVGYAEATYVHRDMIETAGLYYKAVERSVELKDKSAFQGALRAIAGPNSQAEKPLVIIDPGQETQTPCQKWNFLHTGWVGVVPAEKSPLFQQTRVERNKLIPAAPKERIAS